MTKTIVTRYKRADKATEGVILDELCAMTGCTATTRGRHWPWR
ncbi:MAG TPA: hypothetical protein VFJ19_08690 [Nocardioidaceae bacterium]|nr:hypothetical protein [Nocardioidaceae bacterium]